tara:strand:- start:8204 stop:8908 length:705 start_codon:yes stop_codon:yes gene_type:complete
MEQRDLLTINLTVKELKDIKSFCSLNGLKFEEFVDSCFNKGYQIEKYGLLTTDNGKQIIFEEKEIIKKVIVEVEKIVEKEIIVEVPIEVIIEVEKIVEKEIIVEVIVEKPIRVIVEKEVYITDDDKINKLSVRASKLEELKIDLENKILNLNYLLDEKPKEIIKEVIIEKIVNTENKEKLTKLKETISIMSDSIREKDKKILQIQQSMLDLEEIKGPIRGKFMGSTNLNDKLYK